MAINPPPLTPKTKNKINSLIIMISVASLCGLFAACGIWQYLAQQQQRVKELSVTRAVVVASKNIPAGTKLTEEFLTVKQLPAQTVPKDYPESIEGLKKRIVKTTILPEEIITESRLVGQGAAGGLPIIIPPGHRAITIKVDEVFGVGGFINPGDHVDIVAIIKRSEDQNFSRTILQDVLILAAGDKILDPNVVADPAPKVVSQVTVALSPQDAEKLALAHEMGSLHLVLRPHGEKVLVSSIGSTLGDVYGGLFAFSPDGAPMPTTGDLVRNSIEVILGNEKTYQYY